MVNIFVDDERDCPKGFILARTFEEAQNLLQENNGDIDLVSLDQDLNQGFNKLGCYLAKFMEDNNIFPKRVNCHTSAFATMMAEIVRDFLPEEITITSEPSSKLESMIENNSIVS